MPLPLTPFYMIRHGESEANRDGYCSGNQDVLLTDTGKLQAQQAQKTIQSLRNKPTRIIHSHLIRAKETAYIINETLKLPLHEVIHLGEHKFGNWEYKLWKDIRPLFEKGEDPPNGETYAEFTTRITKGFKQALSTEGIPLIVSHGGVFKGFHNIYSGNINGIQNCQLYHFEPAPDNSPMPWVMTHCE